MIAPLRWPLACYPHSIEICEDSSTCWFLPAIADIAAKIRLSIAVAVSCTSSLFSVVMRAEPVEARHSTGSGCISTACASRRRTSSAGIVA